MKILKYVNRQSTYITKGMTVYNKKGKLKFLLGYSWFKKEAGWEFEEGKVKKFGYHKLVMPRTTTKSFTVLKFKLNLVTPTN